MQETVEKTSALERYGIGIAIAVLFVCAIALCVKLFGGFSSGTFMAAGLRAQADRGNAASQYLLGVAYLQGSYGLPKDLEQGKLWLRKAEAQHFAAAGCVLGELHFSPGDTSISDAQAVQWLEEGGQAGDTGCMNTAAWYKAVSADPAVRDPQGAESLVKSALSKHPDAPQYLDTLAAAYAAEGRFDEAAAEQQLAIQRLKSQPGDTTAEAKGMQGRLDLYQSGKAYVEPAAAPAATTASPVPQPDQSGAKP